MRRKKFKPNYFHFEGQSWLR